MKRSMVISIVLVLAVIGAASAQQPAEPAAGEQVIQKGDVLIGGSSSLRFNGSTLNPDAGDSESGTELTLQAYGGYFFTDGIEAGPELTLRYLTGLGDTDLFQVQVGAHFGYFWPMSETLVPYGRLSAGFQFEALGDNDTTGMYITPRIGLNYFITDIVALDGNLFFSYAGQTTDLADGGEEKLTRWEYGLAFGINLFF